MQESTWFDDIMQKPARQENTAKEEKKPAQQTPKLGVINDQGEYVLPPEYVTLVIEKGVAGMFWCRRDDKQGFVDENGQWLFVTIDYTKDYMAAGEMAYTCVPFDRGRYVTPDGYILIVGENNKMGVIDAEGNVIIEPQYDMIRYGDIQEIPYTVFSSDIVF